MQTFIQIKLEHQCQNHNSSFAHSASPIGYFDTAHISASAIRFSSSSPSNSCPKTRSWGRSNTMPGVCLGTMSVACVSWNDDLSTALLAGSGSLKWTGGCLDSRFARYPLALASSVNPWTMQEKGKSPCCKYNFLNWRKYRCPKQCEVSHTAIKVYNLECRHCWTSSSGSISSSSISSLSGPASEASESDSLSRDH